MDIAIDNRNGIHPPANLAADGSAVPAATTEGVATPILNGAGLCITTASDLQKLVDQLKMDQEEQQKKLIDQQFAIVLMRLAAENGQITAAQNEAIAAIGKATDDVAAKKTKAEEAGALAKETKRACEETQGVLDKKLADLETKKGELETKERDLAEKESALADLERRQALVQAELESIQTALAALVAQKDVTLALLKLKTEELKVLIALQQKTPEERAKERAQKAARAEAARAEIQEDTEQTQEEIDARIQELETEIAACTSNLAKIDAGIAAQTQSVQTLEAALSGLNDSLAKLSDERTELNAGVQDLTREIEGLTAGIAAQRGILAEQQAAAAAAAQASQSAFVDLAVAQKNLQSALAALDKCSVAVLADAIALTAAQAKTAAGELPDAEEEDAKAEALMKLAADIKKRIDEKNDAELEKLIMKLPDALSWLAGAERTMSPLDLPERENLV